MARESKFDPEKLRSLIENGTEAQSICQELGISKQTLKNYYHNLMLIDKVFYEISGMSSRSVIPKVSKMGLRISLTKMQNLGFSVGDKVTIRKVEDGKFEVSKTES
jgi:hypothetical protein